MLPAPVEVAAATPPPLSKLPARLTAWTAYCRHELPKPGSSMAQVSAAWRDLDEAARAPFVELALESKEKYAAQKKLLDDFEASGGSGSALSSASITRKRARPR